VTAAVLAPATGGKPMRIAYLCKRRYMGKDVVLDRYARLYEIPYQLARLGHTVDAYCLGYRGADAAGRWVHDAAPGSLTWHAASLGRFGLRGLIRYPRQLLARLRAFQPNLVIAASDIPHVALGAWVSRRLQCPFVADLYDNFEGFGQARIPGMVTSLRRAVCRADLVVTTSEALRDLVIEGYGATGAVVSMPSSVDKSIFRPRDKTASRSELGLPLDARLIGTAGGLYRDKGIEALYAAWPIVAQAMPDTHLVLAGPHEADVPLPTGPRVHYLGALPHERVATLFCALDAGAICILDTPFGRYCFPQKAYEMLACQLPVVAADVGAMGRLFAADPRWLYRVGDAGDLAAKLLGQLSTPSSPHIAIEDWQQLIGKLEPRLQRLAQS
jgi:glycosyltransferase involved in cell wall biosynthesis